MLAVLFRLILLALSKAQKGFTTVLYQWHSHWVPILPHLQGHAHRAITLLGISSHLGLGSVLLASAQFLLHFAHWFVTFSSKPEGVVLVTYLLLVSAGITLLRTWDPPWLPEVRWKRRLHSQRSNRKSPCPLPGMAVFYHRSFRHRFKTLGFLTCFVGAKRLQLPIPKPVLPSAAHWRLRASSGNHCPIVPCEVDTGGTSPWDLSNRTWDDPRPRRRIEASEFGRIIAPPR
jgi:hypothetical protein